MRILREFCGKQWSGNESKLRDWYSDIDDTAPLVLARIVCQRTNLWYDSSLRRSYGKLLVWFVVLVVVLLIVVASLRNLPFLDFVAVAATLSPAVIWATRESYRQLDAADSVETIMGEAERLLEQVKTGGCSDAERERRSREFQDAIYGRRVANPLILPLIYWVRRPEMEKRMKAGISSNLTSAESRRAVRLCMKSCADDLKPTMSSSEEVMFHIPDYDQGILVP